MKINIIIAATLCMASSMHFNAFAVDCSSRTCTTQDQSNSHNYTDVKDGCEAFSYICFTFLPSSSYTSCTKCGTNYTLKSKTVSVQNTCTTVVGYCESNCKGCSNCTSDTSWSSAGTGYEKKVTRTCNCNTCNASTSYRCAAGYYGSSSNGTSGCTRCPSNGNSAAGSTSATGCYITSGSDSTGSFKYTQNCYYK